MDYRRINKFFFATLFNCIIYFANANRIINFNFYNVNGSIDVRFTISQGTPCNGYKIWHSVDSLNFVQVFEDPGICGSNTEDVTKSFLHSGPSPNLTHYYKVELIGTEISPIKRIYLENALLPKLLIYPNPITNFSTPLTIQILNFNTSTQKNKLIGFIYNHNGVPVQSIELIINNGYGNILLNDLKEGLYVIWLTDANQIYKSKFLIQRN